jgi:UrcA family protein
MYFERKHTIAMIARGLAFISALALSPSVAEDVRHVVNERQVVVHYDDLNVSNKPGAQALLYRLSGATTEACGGMPDISNLPEIRAFRACKRDSMDRAVTATGEPTVTELYGLPQPTRVAGR